MEEYGIDLGSKYTVFEQWRRDQLIGNDELKVEWIWHGLTRRTRISFSNREVFVNNHAQSKV